MNQLTLWRKAMNLKQIEDIQKKNAERELSGWLSIVEKELIENAKKEWSECDCMAANIDSVEKVKAALFILSQTTKALRRHGHFLGLDKEE